MKYACNQNYQIQKIVKSLWVPYFLHPFYYLLDKEEDQSAGSFSLETSEIAGRHSWIHFLVTLLCLLHIFSIKLNILIIVRTRVRDTEVSVSLTLWFWLLQLTCYHWQCTIRSYNKFINLTPMGLFLQEINKWFSPTVNMSYQAIMIMKLEYECISCFYSMHIRLQFQFHSLLTVKVFLMQ